MRPITLFLVAGLAWATYPKPSSADSIAFLSNRDGEALEGFAMDPDGTNLARLTPDENTAFLQRLNNTRVDGLHGTRILEMVFFENGPPDDIRVKDESGNIVTRLTDDDSINQFPIWAPDGSKLMFRSNRNHEDFGLFVMDADGGNLVELFPVFSPGSGDESWSPDGQRIAFGRRIQQGFIRLFIIDADGANLEQLVDLRPPSLSVSPRWSPDGSRIAFSGHHDAQINIYVVDADGTNLVQLTDRGLNENHQWSPDGARIVFDRFLGDNREIIAMGSDGSNVVNLTNHPADDQFPLWVPEGERVTAVAEESDTSQPRLNLAPNVPNPFNSDTSIRFQLPTELRIRLSVYDISGQIVTDLASGVWPAGAHSLIWSGFDDAGVELASGVYFYRLSAGKHLTRKLLLLR